MSIGNWNIASSERTENMPRKLLIFYYSAYNFVKKQKRNIIFLFCFSNPSDLRTKKVLLSFFKSEKKYIELIT